MTLEEAIDKLNYIRTGYLFNNDEDSAQALEIATKALQQKLNNKREKLLPCTCGCNRRTTWYLGRGGYMYSCQKCGKEVIGNTQAELRHNWNVEVSNE